MCVTTAEVVQALVFASREADSPVPLYSKYVGMGGRLHFQILSQAPAAVLWGPEPAALASGAGGDAEEGVLFGSAAVEDGLELGLEQPDQFDGHARSARDRHS